MRYFFKIWTRARDKKIFVSLKGEYNILQRLIAKASEKFNIKGEKVALEMDGTIVDEDEILIFLKDETFMLLEDNEQWSDLNTSESSYVSSNASTITVVSENLEHPSDDTNKIQNLENQVNADLENQSPNVIVLPSVSSSQKNEYKWHQFEIPWHKMPEFVLENLQLAQKCPKTSIAEVIKIVVNEMRNISTDIPSEAFKIAAKKLIYNFSETFQDYDKNGIVLGDGCHSVFWKLMDRNNYLNRPHKRQAIFLKPAIPKRLRKSQRNSKAGCSNWQPVPTYNNADIKDVLKTVGEDYENLMQLLEDSYPEQRLFLNNIENPPTVPQVKLEWPVLFYKSVILWHFEKLTSASVAEYKLKISEKSDKIIQFGASKKIESIFEDRVLKSVQVLTDYFKESLFILFYQFEDLDENNLDKVKVDVNEPCIAKIGSNYHVIYEKIKICHTETFQEALVLCFALYFMFNKNYPNQISATLEMIQRYIFKIHPDAGSKSNMNHRTRNRVLTLIRKLS